VTQQTLYKVCPICDQGTVVLSPDHAVYRCGHCHLTLKESKFLGLFSRGRFSVVDWGEGDFTLARQGLAKAALPPDPLKVVLGNVYTDQQLAAIAVGSLDLIQPVKTVLAQIILEQLNEVCHLQVNGLRRGHGQPLAPGGDYWPKQIAPKQGMAWQDQGNLFCTNQRLVFPSNTFTFMRMDRKLVGVQAFNDGLAVQRKGEDFATYFIGCYPHEAALVAAYVIGKLPTLRVSEPESIENQN